MSALALEADVPLQPIDVSFVPIAEVARKQFTDLHYVQLIADGGHWLQQERPAEVNAALLEFLDKLPAG
jgi:pimeloyl-ACP methyl ester carboxylesterase